MNNVISQLAALAQEARLKIFRLLVMAGHGGLTPGKLAEQLGLPAATLSFHLKELSRADLISSKQQGRFIHYMANYEQMNSLVRYLTENCCAGEDCGTENKEKCC